MVRETENQLREYLKQMTVPEIRAWTRANGMSSITRLTKRSELVEAIVRFMCRKSIPKDEIDPR